MLTPIEIGSKVHEKASNSQEFLVCGDVCTVNRG